VKSIIIVEFDLIPAFWAKAAK